MIADKLIETLVQVATVGAVLVPVSLVASWRQRRAQKKFAETLVKGNGEIPKPPFVTATARQYNTEERARLLDPNMGSEIKVERYALGMMFELVIGTRCRLDGSVEADTQFRCQGFVANVPCPDFARVSDFRAANVTTICIGGPEGTRIIKNAAKPEAQDVVACTSGDIDLWHFRNPAPIVDMPTVSPANKFVFRGYYDGCIPPGYTRGDAFRLSVMLVGPASITA